MAARSLNKVQLIGNLTRDPELRYTPSGTAVCTFSVATNRQWTTETGEKKEDVEFTRIVAWQKLAEICGKFLGKGRKVFVEGRLQTRSWKGQDGNDRQTTEVVISDMIILDSSGRRNDSSYNNSSGSAQYDDKSSDKKEEKKSSSKKNVTKKETKEKSEPSEKSSSADTEDVPPDDIPF